MGKDWWKLNEKGYLSSLLTLERDDEEKLEFHGAFVPAVAESLIGRLTEEGDWVWDPFAGSGTTGKVAERMGRKCFMSDLNPTSDEIAGMDARSGMVVLEDHPRVGYVGRRFLFDLIILHPPYHDVIKFSEKSNDMSNCSTVDEFLNCMVDVGFTCWEQLKVGGYVGLVMGDVWVDSEVCLLGLECFRRIDSAFVMKGGDAKLKSIQVKNIEGHARHRAGQRNLWLSRHARYGSVTFDHEYIFSIQKR